MECVITAFQCNQTSTIAVKNPHTARDRPVWSWLSERLCFLQISRGQRRVVSLRPIITCSLRMVKPPVGGFILCRPEACAPNHRHESSRELLSALLFCVFCRRQNTQNKEKICWGHPKPRQRAAALCTPASFHVYVEACAPTPKEEAGALLRELEIFVRFYEKKGSGVVRTLAGGQKGLLIETNRPLFP